MFHRLAFFVFFLIGLIDETYCQESQYEFFRANNIEVFSSENLLKFPWVGGLNSPQFSKIDLNNDDLEDLFVFDREDNRVLTFINTGGIGFNYIYAPKYEELFPNLNSWVLLRDYNNDGKKDIFTYDSGGIKVFKNISEPFQDVEFVEASNPIIFSVHPPNPSPISIFSTSLDIPSIDDIDGDGDLDILTIYFFTSSGGTGVVYHRNYSMELYGHADSLVFELKNDCWGHSSEDFSSTSRLRAILKDTCSNVYNDAEFNPFTGNPDLFGNNQMVVEYESYRHTSGCLLTLDINGDGVRDLLMGDSDFNNILQLTNDDKGVNMNTSFISQDTLFPSNTTPILIQSYPCAYYEDIDNDGVKDLIATPNETNFSNNSNSAMYYKNMGSTDNPIFSYVQSDLMQFDMLEFGSGARPVFVDYNGDGLMDIVVGNYGYFNTTISAYQTRLALLKNVGTPNWPSFELVTKNFANLSSVFGMGLNISPAFADLDGDGDVDMLLGDSNGFLHYFENTAAIGVPAVYSQNELHIKDYNNVIIDVGQNASPVLIDVDLDGDYDLVVGNSVGKLQLIINDGNATNPIWVLQTDNWGEVDVSEWFTPIGNSYPSIFRDENGVLQLFVGSARGTIFHFDDIESNLFSGEFNLVDSMVGDIKLGTNSTQCLADLNNNGYPEMIVGTKRGGLAYFASTVSDASQLHDFPIAQNQTKVYPNPTTDNIVVEFSMKLDRKFYLYDVNGTLLKTDIFNQQINVLFMDDLPSGIYFLMIDSSKNIERHKIIRY